MIMRDYSALRLDHHPKPNPYINFVRKDMDSDDHERLSIITLRHKFK